MSVNTSTISFAPSHARDTESTPADVTRKYECRIRLNADGVGIVSPRTGKALFVPCEAAPESIRLRIVHARSTGVATHTFTVEELKAFAEAAKALEAKSAPRTPERSVYAAWQRRPRGRRRFGR